MHIWDMALFGSSFVMGVAFQCMVRLTVYAMSYELYVVEWYDGERCARTMLLIKCGFLVRKGQLNRHAQRYRPRPLSTATRNAQDRRALFSCEMDREIDCINTQNEKSSQQPFHLPTRHLPPGKPCYSTP